MKAQNQRKGGLQMAKYRAVFDNSQAAALRGIADTLDGDRSRLLAAANAMDARDGSMAALRRQIRAVADAMPVLSSWLRSEGKVWDSAALRYRQAEQETFTVGKDTSILGAFIIGGAVIGGAMLWDYIFNRVPAPPVKVHSNSEAYTGSGTYGGNQGSPAKNWKEVKSIVLKYFPDWTDKRIKEYLNELNSEGCGYVALCNTIFARYYGREEEFEKTFGFPMYKDGDLNFDAMIVDFYSANYADYGMSRHGTTEGERELMWESYMVQHGVTVDVDNSVRVTPDNYGELVKKGEIIIRMSPVQLIDKSGEIIKSDGGHAMTITGVTEDGKYIVSSWGKEYYVDPNAPGDYNLDYQQVRYK
jgi:hypothetical protein